MISRRKNNNLMDWRLGPNWSELTYNHSTNCEEEAGSMQGRYPRSCRTSVNPPLLPTTNRVGTLLTCTKLSRLSLSNLNFCREYIKLSYNTFLMFYIFFFIIYREKRKCHHTILFV